MVQETSGYFGVGGRHVYGTLHVAEEAAPEQAMVILSPFGEERKCAYRLLVRVARACAAQRVGVLRFDFSGTGESSGDHAEATAQQWVEDSCVALDAAVRLTGVDACCILGARLGANLAVRVAAARSASTLILVEPLLTGADFLRDLERRQQIKAMMGTGENGSSGAPDAASQWAAGTPVDFGGVEVGPRLAAELGEVDLGADLRRVQPGCAVHLLRVTGARKFPASWQTAVEQAEQTPGGEAVILVDKPFWGQLEYYESPVVVDAVVRALSGRSAVAAR